MLWNHSPSRPANNSSGSPEAIFHGDRDSICMSASGDDLFCLRDKTILVADGRPGSKPARSSTAGDGYPTPDD